MTVYMTKVWGFGVPCGPLQFSTNGWREAARDMLRPGDLVVVVGTKGFQTEQEFQGRALGIMEPTREVVSCLDFDLENREVDFDEDGEYRWPYGLLNRRAWEILNPPLFEDISVRQFSMDSASGIVPLTEEEGAFVLTLVRREVSLLAPIRAIARIEGIETARRRGAPAPTTKRTGIMHYRRAPAYTYMMTVGDGRRPAVKFGWAFDYRLRERGFNSASLPLLGGLRYKTALFHLWGTARAAYKMEQALLRTFRAQQHPSNREVIFDIDPERLQAAWVEYLQASRTHPASG